MRRFVLACALVGGLAPAAADPKARSPESIQRVVRGRVNALQGCYEQARQRAPDLAGKFVYTLTIAADGRVRKAAAKAPSKTSEALDRCVTTELGQLAFGAGPETTIVYPFVFEPQAPAETTAPEPAPKATPTPATPKASSKKAPDVDPKLVKMFDDAAAKARAGKHADALAGYRAVLELQRKQKLAVIPRFTSTLHLHISYALIDLGKLTEAEQELARVDVSTLGTPTQYDYHFTLGNVLGGLGKLRPMFSELGEAISIAEDLDDWAVRPPLCWTKILAFTMKAQDWAYLKEVSETALSVARVRGYEEIETKALVALSEAKKHLKK
ncbi:MAG TPA: AgmX/PglI C-terminal domain-containing protein [Kofleriaceae bacterium]|nr:AgmX/PglI C-terminal domain-containing protein [Kofleriaceae bacterium]